MDQLPPPCKGGCGRPVRPVGTTKDDYPITRTWLTKARGMCIACWSNAPRIVVKNPGACLDCGLRLLPRGSKRIAGTAIHDSKGLCMGCRGRHRRGTANGPKPPRCPERCVECSSKLRPRHTTLKTYPCTKEHAGKGLCRGCKYLHITEGRPRRIPAPPKPAKVPHEKAPVVLSEITDPGALRFHEERQERRKKAERIAAARREAEAVRRRFIARRAA